MPEFSLSMTEVDDLIAYLKSIQTRRAVRLILPAGPPRRG
jgi:hypothetical protein